MYPLSINAKMYYGEERILPLVWEVTQTYKVEDIVNFNEVIGRNDKALIKLKRKDKERLEETIRLFS